MGKEKSYEIPKRHVWEAWKQVKANKGAAGVDDQSVEDFEKNLKNNLYKLWNRMSAGSYMPKPVRKVLIPKSDGGRRELGIPTVEDRIAQTVVKMYLEPKLEPYFVEDSYGYRPRKSAKGALGVTRQRCWKYDWVIDIDIRAYFGSINHELLMRAVRQHTQCKWVILYIERWLRAPVREEDGMLRAVVKGTPQGGVISPLLANLFLHYAFDIWMKKHFPDLPFARFADDAVVHCRTEEQAQAVKEALEQRLKTCELELHPEKTKIVYCKDDNRKEEYPSTKFNFLGFTFRPRRLKSRLGSYFVGFTPAVSNEATKELRTVMRRWALHRRTNDSLEELACVVNPVVRGWLNYFGAFHKSATHAALNHLNRILARWAMNKLKRLKQSRRQATYWLGRIARTEPDLFVHWAYGVRPATAQ